MQIASMMLQEIEADRDEEGNKTSIGLPNLASVKVPQVTLPPSNVARVGASRRSPFGTTETITDIEELALKQVDEMPDDRERWFAEQ